MSAGKRHFSGERLYYRKINQWKEPTHQEPIEGLKVWILLGYPSNILGYQSKYCNYTSKKKLGRFPHSPRPPAMGNFFTLPLKKNISDIKDAIFDFRMGCILVLFLFLRIIHKFRIFEIWIFLSSKLAILAYFDQKSIFIMEII